ncbi:MAG: galactokinase family protein [Pyrinomonadaceae bacterium]
MLTTTAKIECSTDLDAFVETLKEHRQFFDGANEIIIARAPGRLDVMGGIADYSGSMVLEMPIAEAAFAGIQKIDEPIVRIRSLGTDSSRTHEFQMPIEDLISDGGCIEYAAAREYFRREPSDSWAAYVAGAFVVLMREKGVRFREGVNVLLDSKVPEGKGVSSSAAIEVATMTAIAAAFDIEIDARELAILCQKVENLVVGAPCGIMDQMTSAAGEAGRLLSMVCQPAEVGESVAIPDGIEFWGIDSGIRHSVSGDDYGSVRTGAFMGYRMIAEAAGLAVKHVADGVVEIDDPEWQGYLANITPVEFEKRFVTKLPRVMTGEEFLAKYYGITDTVTTVLADKTYSVLCPTRHPIYENSRVQEFAKLLASAEPDLEKLGTLMYASHESYSSCGLGTKGTDLLVELVRQLPNLFGAKITGGGSGGTVAVLGRKGGDAEVKWVADEYKERTGHRPHIFAGSTNGAAGFGHIQFSFGS